MNIDETITLSDGDLHALLSGKTVGPWLLQDVTVEIEVDDWEASQHMDMNSTEYWRAQAEQSDKVTWCEGCEKSYFNHFDSCPHHAMDEHIDSVSSGAGRDS